MSATMIHQRIAAGCVLAFCLCWLGIAEKVQSAEYYVSSETGDNSNDGSREHPFKDPSCGAARLRSGDTLILLAGRYHDILSTNREVEGATNPNPIPGDQWQDPARPVVIRAEEGQKVVFDGTVAISDISEGAWEPYKSGIYRIRLKRDIWELFDNGEVQTSARWPNAFWYDGSIWDQSRWASFGDNTYLKNREYIDADTKPFPHCDIAKAGFDATGALAIMNISNFDTYCEMVTEHGKGNPRFKTKFNEYGNIRALPIMRGPDNDGKVTRQFKKDEGRLLPIFNLFFLECSLELLDAPTEWFYDKDSKYLYYYPMDGKNPQGRDVRGKVQTYAFDLWNVRGVVLKGLNFFGTTISFRGTGEDNDNCTHITVEDCDFLYPSYSKRMLGDNRTPEITQLATDQPRHLTIWNPRHFTVRNCTFRKADGSGIHMAGADNILDNCLFEQIDYSVIDPSSGRKEGKQMTFRGNDDTVQVRQSPGIVIHRVTVNTAGSAHSIPNGANVKDIKKPNVQGDKNAKFSVVSYCRVIRGGLLQVQDGANFHIWQFDSDYGTFDHCWAQDTTKWGYRFDGAYAPDPAVFEFNSRLDHCRVSYCVAWNMSRDHVFTGKSFVRYGSGSFILRGDWHYVYNNLGLGEEPAPIYIASEDGGNTHTEVYNNVARAMSGKYHAKGPEPFNGHQGQNIGAGETIDPAQLLRDPQNMDFRPRAGSPLIDSGKYIDGVTTDVVGTAPDIGPYEYGAKVYWIPGYQSPSASTPIPPDGATTAKPDLDLMWLPGYQAGKHTVCFGRSADAMTRIGEFTDGNICSPGPLTSGTTYFWRVDTIDRNGQLLTGPVWTFTVQKAQ
ncbi:MAG: hypothetical protein GC162_07395 [Planctomycetes bacterium]|nr:hypothetical protein [Planctomycetota bacterium]